MRIDVPTYWPREPCGLGFLAEAPGDGEITRHLQRREKGKVGCPLTGNTRWRHEAVIKEAGADRWRCWHSNVFLFQLPMVGGKNNSIAGILVNSAEIDTLRDAWRDTNEPEIPLRWRERILRVTGGPIQRKWLPPAEWPSLVRLYDEVTCAVSDGTLKVLVLYGETALWAMTGSCDLKRTKGHLFELEDFPGLKMIATYHPSASFRQETSIRITAAAVQKAWAEIEGGEAAFYEEPKEILVPETIGEMRGMFEEHLRGAQRIAVDIETPYVRYAKRERVPPPVISDRARPVNPKGELFTVNSIQFCADDTAIYIPFAWREAPNGCWWASESEHLEALELIRGVIEDQKITKVYQRGTFDLQLLTELLGLMPDGPHLDTLLMASAENPEEEKNLSMLGAKHMNVRPWKRGGMEWDKEE